MNIKDVLAIFSIVLLGISGGLAGSAIFYQFVDTDTPTPTDYFLRTARLWADKHDYNLTSYNCKNYTNDVQDIADIFGVETEQVTGCNINGSCHRWLRVTLDFEPQYGRFVDYSGVYK